MGGPKIYDGIILKTALFNLEVCTESSRNPLCCKAGHRPMIPPVAVDLLFMYGDSECQWSGLMLFIGVNEKHIQFITIIYILLIL